ncbi:MAG: hypothetical protein E4H36_08095 [Spirochaetales bacterium]|nr:MAG: hypothetical protein E4H36_08095 [Spirochaetales bacterium]
MKKTTLKKVGVLLLLTGILILPAAGLFAAGVQEFRAGAGQQAGSGLNEQQVLQLIKTNQKGVDFAQAAAETCGPCHSATPKYPVPGAKLSYEFSGHNLGFEKEGARNSWYANGGGCQQCHTNEGFNEYIRTGKVTSEYIEYPSQQGCFTCHDPHARGDFSLLSAKPVKLSSGDVFDKGLGNLCANCHTARGKLQDLKATPADKLGARGLGHHGPEADVFLGKNAYQFGKNSYGSSAHTSVVGDACVTCHMALPEARYGMMPWIGGHSFSLGGEVHGSEVLNLSACTSCHTDMKQEGEYFNIKKEDWDGDGKVEVVQAEVKGLLDRFKNDAGTGVFQTMALPIYNKDGSWNATKDTTVRSADVVGAFNNYLMLLEDRSLGIHNTKYTVQVLMDSIKAVDSKYDDSKRPK